MASIARCPFGATGHMSTRTIFGSFCLCKAGSADAEEVLETLLAYGINHIDTAPRYGDAELRVGEWMKHHRQAFFLATKIDQVTYEDARDQFNRSLDRLQVECVDLLQLHNLTDVARREIIMGPGGAMEFLVEAREEKLTRFIGVTGHGILAPKMHRQTLERFDFDSVLLPCNYPLMQHPDYAGEFHHLISYCRERSIAVQTIKSVARGYWGSRERTHVTWYEPLTDEGAISKCVHWVLAMPDLFLITVGDKKELPKVLSAASRPASRPSQRGMDTLVQEHGIEPIFV